jgi:hypothetical protein
VRFPSQNQQFGGAFSSQQQPQQPQFASFPAQQPRQPPPAQRPPFTAFNQFSPSTPVVPTQTGEFKQKLGSKIFFTKKYPKSKIEKI